MLDVLSLKYFASFALTIKYLYHFDLDNAKFVIEQEYNIWKKCRKLPFIPCIYMHAETWLTQDLRTKQSNSPRPDTGSPTALHS